MAGWLLGRAESLAAEVTCGRERESTMRPGAQQVVAVSVLDVHATVVVDRLVRIRRRLLVVAAELL